MLAALAVHAIEVPVRFRLCREQDLPALEWMGLHTREREIIGEAFTAQQRGEAALLLACANEFPVGQAWLDTAARGSAQRPWLWAVRVFPPLQGAGLGTRLMAEAEALARRREAHAIELGVEWSNPAARRFYRRQGYEPVGRSREVVDYCFEGAPLRMEIDQEVLRKSLRWGGA